jgi:hypothetical protein
MGKRRPIGDAAERITQEALRELFTTQVIRFPLAMPADADLIELARILEGWRLIFHSEKALHHRHDLQREAFTAFEILEEAVSKIAELDEATFGSAIREGAPQSVLVELAKRKQKTTDIHARTERIGSMLRQADGEGLGTGGWKWLADVLPEDFVNAMKPTNPTFEPGLGHTGPVARFIAAVAPMLTGEHPTANSVATQLKIRRKMFGDMTS